MDVIKKNSFQYFMKKLITISLLLSLLLQTSIQQDVVVSGKGQPYPNLPAEVASNWQLFYSGFQDATFSNLDGWIITSGASTTFALNSLLFNCGGTTVVGGPKSFGKGAVASKEFKNLPPHFQVKVNLQLWKFDEWDETLVILDIDGSYWNTVWSPSQTLTKICDTPSNKVGQYKQDVEFVFSHSGSQLVFLITSMNEKVFGLASFGFTKVSIYIKPCPQACGVCSGDDPYQCFMWESQGFAWMNFENDIEGWTIEVGRQIVQSCSGIKIFGGLNQFGKQTSVAKTFNKLAPHYRVKVLFQFWKIDAWAGSQAQLFIDRNQRWGEVSGDADEKGLKICPKSGGVDLPERLINGNVETNHNYDAVNFKFTTSLPSDTKLAWASWGIRSFQFFIAKCAPNCSACTGPTSEECTACQSPFVLDEEDGTGCYLEGSWEAQEKDLQGGLEQISNTWVVRGNKNGPDFKSSCNEITMLGGFDKFGSGAVASRKFTLPAHKRVRFTFDVWKIDDWSGESITVKFDGIVVWQKSFGFGDSGTIDICGGDGFENLIKVDVIVGHENPTLDFVISSDLPQSSKGFWGIRDIKTFIEKPDFCATLYTECNYRGKSFNLCGENENFSKSKYPSKVKSVQVPQGGKVTLFDEESFKGGYLEYTQNEPCIEQYNFASQQKFLLQLNDVLVGQKQ
ncbi:hypothetical protein pb186bvf_006571 [Paramecium bursaria]